MDERHLKYLYTALAVLFGLPSLAMGGAAATMLLLMGLGQFGHGTLASVTVMPLWGLAGIAGHAHHRCDVDDAALARLHHAAHHRLAGAEHAGQVGVDDRRPVLVLHAHQQVVAGDAGIVHQDRDRAEFLGDAIEHTVQRGGVGDVQRAAVATVGGQALTDRGGAGFGGGGADDGGALGGQQIGDGGTNATAGAGDQCDFTLQGLAHDVFLRLGRPPYPYRLQRPPVRSAGTRGIRPTMPRGRLRSRLAWPANGRRWPCRYA